MPPAKRHLSPSGDAGGGSPKAAATSGANEDVDGLDTFLSAQGSRNKFTDVRLDPARRLAKFLQRPSDDDGWEHYNASDWENRQNNRYNAGQSTARGSNDTGREFHDAAYYAAERAKFQQQNRRIADHQFGKAGDRTDRNNAQNRTGRDQGWGSGWGSSQWDQKKKW